jgi:hypothetical protein
VDFSQGYPIPNQMLSPEGWGIPIHCGPVPTAMNQMDTGSTSSANGDQILFAWVRPIVTINDSSGS